MWESVTYRRYELTARNDDGDEITCVLLRNPVSVRYGDHRRSWAAAFMDVADSEAIYTYEPDTDTFHRAVKARYMVI